MDVGTPEPVSVPGTAREDQGWLEALFASLTPRVVAESSDVVYSGGVRGGGHLRTVLPERPAPAAEPFYESLFMPELVGPAPAAEPFCESLFVPELAGPAPVAETAAEPHYGAERQSPSEATPRENAGVGRSYPLEGQGTAAPPGGERGSLTSRSRGRTSSTPSVWQMGAEVPPDGVRGSLTSRSRGRTSSTPSVWRMGAEVLPPDGLGDDVQFLGEKSV